MREKNSGILRVLAPITYCGTFSLFKVTFTRAYEINSDFDVFANEFFAKEFSSVLCILSLFRI